MPVCAQVTFSRVAQPQAQPRTGAAHLGQVFYLN